MLALASARDIRGGDGYPPDPDGWIRQWIVYGPIGTLPSATEVIDQFSRHPVTSEPLVAFDLIAEAAALEGRWTERNFLPAPGREIATAFGTVTPGHVLRDETGSGINPHGKLMGIGWSDCDCTVDFSEVLGAGFDAPQNVMVYAYTYLENVSGEILSIFLSMASDDGVHVLLGKVPEDPGPDFLESVYLHNDFGGIGDTPEPCLEYEGPSPDPGVPSARRRVIHEPLTLEPGLHLLLAKVVNPNAGFRLRLRLRNAEGPDFAPLGEESIRIHLERNLDRPGLSPFRRGDSNGDGEVGLADAVSTLEWLFRAGAEPSCADAADSDDDGQVTLTDAIATLSSLFLGAPLPFSRSCCGLDPTHDDLPPCRSERGC